MMGGLFITFEGIEGSGKTTQAKRLYKYLKKKKIPCIFTREPGGPRISEKIRRLLLDAENYGMSKKTELLLYAASRAEHVSRIIRPALKIGKVVISDRFSDSTFAYQGGGRKISMRTARMINDFATERLKPNLTFIIDLPVRVGLKRLSKIDRIEKEREEFHIRVRSEYLKIAKEEPQRVKIIDGTKGVEEQTKEIVSVVHRYLKRRAR